MKIDIDKLLEYKEKGLLRCQKHNELPLLIWNYSEKVQFDDLWDDITLMCRGLVTDHDGNIIARPFKKFFNIEQNRHKETDSFEIYEKMDGSLGILFNYKGEWIMATRGSFHSEQAIRGAKMLKEYNIDDYPHDMALNKEVTYLFEIIYKENRIVVNYDFESLINLGAVKKDGTDFKIPEYFIFSTAKKFQSTDYKSIQALNTDNAEGFVVKFSNGDRCKIKFENYIDLHRKISNISEKAVWELICEKKPIEDMLDIIPDEFHEQVKSWHWAIMLNFSDIEIKVRNKYYALPTYEARKDFAIAIKDDEDKGILFKLLDGKDIYDDICKAIKPDNSKSLMFSN